MNTGISTIQSAARATDARRTPLRTRVAGAFVAIAALLAVVASPVSAAAFKNANISRTSACHYTVTFTWESMGHGSDLTAHVYLIGFEGTNSSVIDTHSFSPKTGRTGYVSWDFVSTETTAYRYQGYGYLQTSRGTVIAKSEATSASLVPGSPESCAP